MTDLEVVSLIANAVLVTIYFRQLSSAKREKNLIGEIFLAIGKGEVKVVVDDSKHTITLKDLT
jgi:hypothetical protein